MSISKEVKQQLRDIVRNTPILSVTSLNRLEKLLNATRMEFERMATGGLKVQTTTPSYLSQ